MTDRTDPEETGGEPLEQLLDYLTAQRFFLSIAETRAAKAMLAEGFDFVEVAGFLQNSAWGAFYRASLVELHLPELPCVLTALREAFDLRLSPQDAAERALDALRQHVETQDGHAVTSDFATAPHNAETLAFEIELFGVDGVRRKNWPDWMRGLVNAPDKGSEPDGAVL
jgi:hypothetical protein